VQGIKEEVLAQYRSALQRYHERAAVEQRAKDLAELLGIAYSSLTAFAHMCSCMKLAVAKRCCNSVGAERNLLAAELHTYKKAVMMLRADLASKVAYSKMCESKNV
jgi:hypothetical protein